MKLGIMQPYFFPYAQQFRHIAQCDRWIVFDTPKFSRKSWISRNRILNKDTKWSYISVPITKGASELPIAQAGIAQTNWKKKLQDHLKVYEYVAPYYYETMEVVEQCLRGTHASIAELNTHILRTICAYLDIETEITPLSTLSLDLPIAAEPGEWACHISKALNADVYSNASGGKHLFDSEYYKKNGIALEFYRPCSLEYPTPGFQFVPDLSVLDSCMWMGCAALKEWCTTPESERML